MQAHRHAFLYHLYNVLRIDDNNYLGIFVVLPLPVAKLARCLVSRELVFLEDGVQCTVCVDPGEVLVPGPSNPFIVRSEESVQGILGRLGNSCLFGRWE